MMRPILSRLRSDCQGSMAVEFALLAPVFLAMIFGVLYVGMALQNYNAVRNLSADVARYAVIAHQSGNTLSNSQLRTYAVTHAQGAPYLLRGSGVDATVSTPTTQRVAGVIERQITITYEFENVVDFVGINAPFISYTRPIFLLDNTAP
jgi:Flp pilus assembly protein TadG